jgi:hypothetical protein
MSVDLGNGVGGLRVRDARYHDIDLRGKEHTTTRLTGHISGAHFEVYFFFPTLIPTSKYFEKKPTFLYDISIHHVTNS